MPVPNLPFRPQPQGPEDITEIMANFDALVSLLAGNLANDNIADDAEIHYSKLNLTAGLTNADVAAAAALVVSKLAAGGSGTILKSAAGVAQWVSGPAGALIYQTASDIAYTNAPVDGQELHSVGTVPTWVTTPRVRLRRTADQSIPDSTDTAVSFGAGTEVFDNDTMHDTTTNPTRITIKTAGAYLLGGSVAFATSATGRREISVRLNGSGGLGGSPIIDSRRATNASGSSTEQLGFTTFYEFAVNDYVEMLVFQNSGGSLNLNSVANYSPVFWAVRL